MAKPEPGEWVQVWGQVKLGDAHPEDTLVEFTSHSEMFIGHILTERILLASEPPDFAGTCPALFRFAGGDNGLFVRCSRHEGHRLLHYDDAGTTYQDSEIVGYIEEAT